MSTQRLVLELEVGSDPIAGRVQDDDDGRERRFAGWIELAAALEALSSGPGGAELAEEPCTP